MGRAVLTGPLTLILLLVFFLTIIVSSDKLLKLIKFKLAALHLFNFTTKFVG
jgi:hypothetical protein